jgi:hypothetical protein
MLILGDAPDPILTRIICQPVVTEDAVTHDEHKKIFKRRILGFGDDLFNRTQNTGRELSRGPQQPIKFTVTPMSCQSQSEAVLHEKHS